MITPEKIKYYPHHLFGSGLNNWNLQEIVFCKDETDRQRKLKYFSKAGLRFKACGYTTGVIIREGVADVYYTLILSDKEDERRMIYSAAEGYCKNFDDGFWTMPNRLMMQCIIQNLAPGFTSLRKITEPFHALGNESLLVYRHAYWTQDEIEGPTWYQKLCRFLKWVRNDIKTTRPVRIMRFELHNNDEEEDCRSKENKSYVGSSST